MTGGRDGTEDGFELAIRVWPGGGSRLVDFHGNWVDWLAA
jgi:hypothetical protein